METLPSHIQFQSFSPVNACQEFGARGVIDLLGRLAAARKEEREKKDPHSACPEPPACRNEIISGAYQAHDTLQSAATCRRNVRYSLGPVVWKTSGTCPPSVGILRSTYAIILL
ncbi:hypothetical protein CGRA01v4_01002 [Colletotrichum graminicola]|nr:hypothetical protein CGRA01v4_01002 [Colletotrichum graminicola]